MPMVIKHNLDPVDSSLKIRHEHPGKRLIIHNADFRLTCILEELPGVIQDTDMASEMTEYNKPTDSSSAQPTDSSSVLSLLQ